MKYLDEIKLMIIKMKARNPNYQLVVIHVKDEEIIEKAEERHRKENNISADIDLIKVHVFSGKRIRERFGTYRN